MEGNERILFFTKTSVAKFLTSATDSLFRQLHIGLYELRISGVIKRAV